VRVLVQGHWLVAGREEGFDTCWVGRAGSGSQVSGSDNRLPKVASEQLWVEGAGKDDTEKTIQGRGWLEGNYGSESSVKKGRDSEV